MEIIEQRESLRSYKYLSLLCMLYTTALVSSATLVYKPISVLGIGYIPGATLVFPLTYFFGDIIAEIYGFQEARRLIWYSMLCELAFACFSYVGAIAPYPDYWQHQAAYTQVLGLMPRVFLGSFVGTVTGIFLSCYIITKWKVLVRGKYFILRSIVSSAIGETSLSIITVFIIFYGTTPGRHIIVMMITGYLFKIAYTTILSFPASIVITLLKRYEKTNVYDCNTNFNPFRID